MGCDLFCLIKTQCLVSVLYTADESEPVPPGIHNQIWNELVAGDLKAFAETCPFDFKVWFQSAGHYR